MNADLLNLKIGFIGAGNMAKAIGFSILEAGLVSANQILAAAPSFRNLDVWKEKGIEVTTNNSDVVSKCDIVFLAMKPQYLDEAMLKLKTITDPKTTLYISILVGVTIASIKEKFKTLLNWTNIDVIRVMPNTPLSVGAGCSILCHSLEKPDANVKRVVEIMSAGGTCEVVKESLFNALSTVSGSGPAYMYLMIEALSDGAVKVGAPRDLAMRLVAQTMLGAAQMVLKSGKHPGELKDNVCSPGGSTIAAIHAMEKSAVRSGLINAVEAAYNRTEEIKQGFK